jgi:type I restriction enzyme M protein
LIKKENFRNVLEKLGFESGLDEVWKSGDFSVDFVNEKLNYPEKIKIHDQTTTNFSANENFVVFEATFRLVKRGYKPEDIELEPKWLLGHKKKGGKADILVLKENEETKEKESFLILECKTWGTEFEKEKRKMEENGGQLFSYWQQEQSTKYLVLYSSEFENDEINYISAIVPTTDKESLVKDFEKAGEKAKKKIKLYKNAKNVEEKFETWNRSYNKYFFYKGIFEKGISPYKIEQKPLLKGDLKIFGESDGDRLFNQFAEILRHNHIGKKENAFSILVTMFLCKFVDEQSSGDEVKFQWRPYDDEDEKLQDRLQSLYHIGMKKYLDLETIYYSEDYINDSCKYHQKDVGIDKLKTMLKEMKFYKSNEFGFKSVQNEKLFKDNARVVKEVVQLLEPYKFVYAKKEKILSNMFEKFLKMGFQQDEGQFFTPLPITKFVTSSLIEKKELDEEIPKLIDYSCGSGHFMLEAFDQINSLFKPEKNWEQNYIYGIEKDDSLVKISKVSSFLNGSEKMNIIYGNGLEEYEDLGVKSGTFDLILANPPYSIKNFKSTLEDEIHNEFELLKHISENSPSIEVLFIERAKQLLKKGGKSGIILPSSILSNDGIYRKAREIILRYFRIVAIVEFGSNTFVATGTNTITLFLQRVDDFDFRHFQVRSENIFSNRFEERLGDKWYLEQYLKYRQINFSDYKTLLEKNPNEKILNSDFYKDFLNSLKKDEKKNVIQKLLELEAEKFTYFHTAFTQKTLVIKSGDKKVEKEFLGYEWSNRKGNEGLKEYVDENGKFNSKLYDDENLEKPTKSNFFVREAFRGNLDLEIPENLENHVSYLNLIDMLDFSQTDFSKAINTNADKKVEIETKWNLVKLEEICDVLIGGTPSRKNNLFFNGSNLWVSISEMNGEEILDTKEKITNEAIEKSNVKLIPKNTTLLSFKLSIGKTAIAGKDLYTNEAIAGLIIKDKTKVLDKYLFTIFNAEFIPLQKVGSNTFGKSLNSKFLREQVKVPLPPLSVQNVIVSEIEKIDDEVAKAKEKISQLKNKISETIDSASGQMTKLKNVTQMNPSKTEIKDIPPETTVSFVEMSSVSNDGFIETKVDKKLSELKKGSFTYFYEGDILIAKITPSMENGKCGIAENLTNDLGMGSSEFHVIRAKKEILNKYLFTFLNREDIRVNAQKVMTGASGHRRVPIWFYEKLEIPLPDLKTQKEIVSKIETIEKEISELNSIVENSKSQKNQILEKYLK